MLFQGLKFRFMLPSPRPPGSLRQEGRGNLLWKPPKGIIVTISFFSPFRRQSLKWPTLRVTAIVSRCLAFCECRQATRPKAMIPGVADAARRLAAKAEELLDGVFVGRRTVSGTCRYVRCMLSLTPEALLPSRHLLVCRCRPSTD